MLAVSLIRYTGPLNADKVTWLFAAFVRLVIVLSHDISPGLSGRGSGELGMSPRMQH